MNCKGMLVCCASLLLATATATWAAQFVEVEAVIDVTTWRYDEQTSLSLKNSRSFSVRCVVGTNAWFIENDARTNYKESVWFVDGKIIRQLAYTGYTQRSAFDDSEGTYGRRGRSANVTASSDGYPSGDMFLNLPWFAFCSGPYFKRPGRSVPLPAPASDRAAFGFTDETALFTDGLGLPRQVDLFTANRDLKARYRVQQSTNVLGWSFPLAFTVVQNEPDGLNVWKRQVEASGRVTRIRRASRPELPEEIQERLELLEQSPTRRRRSGP